MAIGWLTVLKAVPWVEVISNAPKVADGARKLWNTVGRKTADPEVAAPTVPEGVPGTPPTLEALQARLRTLEVRSAELHEQMLASSELIKALADQNTELIRRVEANRVRVRWLSLAVAVLGLAFSLVLIFGRSGATP